MDGQKLADRGYLGVEIEAGHGPVWARWPPSATSFSTMWQATTAEVAGMGQIFSPQRPLVGRTTR